MEWQQLEYFQTVANLQHITLSAEKLNITQPALSRSIGRLENELGVPLFDREGRSIILNRYGKSFLKHVTRIINEYGEAKREMQDMINPDMGEVSLGFLHTLGYSYIPDLIKGFIRKYPGIKFQLHQNNTPALVSQLTSGEVDFCILASINDIPRIEWTNLWSQELYVIVPAGHHLANDEEINLEQIADESLISFKEGYGIRKIIDDSLKKAGINPTVTFEGEEVRTVIGLVEAGLGVALIPDIKGIDRKKISMLHIKSPEVKREIGIAGMSGQYLSPAALRFLKYVTEKFK